MRLFRTFAPVAVVLGLSLTFVGCNGDENDTIDQVSPPADTRPGLEGTQPPGSGAQPGNVGTNPDADAPDNSDVEGTQVPAIDPMPSEPSEGEAAPAGEPAPENPR